MSETTVTMRFLDPRIVDAFLEVIGKTSIFTVVFKKKDGTERKMTCQRGVKKHLQGGESTIKEHENLVGVYEQSSEDYRCFDKNRVRFLKGGDMELIRNQPSPDA